MKTSLLVTYLFSCALNVLLVHEISIYVCLDVLNTLNQLQDSFHIAKEGDDDSGSENEFWLDLNTEIRPTNVPGNNNEYYQITYM